MPKTVKILFYFLVGMICFSIVNQVQAVDITFTADTELSFSSVPSTLYINTGSACDSLTVTASTLLANIPASSYVELETAANSVLKVTPSGALYLYFDTSYFSTGYIIQWIASSSLSTTSAEIIVKVPEIIEQYRVNVDNSHYNDYTSNSNGFVTFTYIGTFSSNTKTFTISKVAPAIGGGGGASVTPSVDITAPSISNVKDTISNTQNIITWGTDESSLSWILYGTSTSFGLEEKTTDYIISHSITLKNLLPETTYFYRIKSKDSKGNEGSYTDKVFTTLSSSQAAETISKPLSQMTTGELQAEIIRITALITQLQSQLAGTVSGGVKITGIPSNFTFKTTLKSGTILPEVKYLQLILNSDSQTKLASSGVGSSGNETNIFGTLTKAAVIKFQNKYVSEILTPLGLTKGTGIVGKATINKLNSLLGK